MKEEDQQRIQEIAGKLGVSAEELNRHLVDRKPSATPAKGSGSGVPQARGLLVGTHRICRWAIPIGIVLLSLPAGVLVARLFSSVQGLGNIVFFVGIAVAVVSTLILQKVGIACPQCGAKLEFYAASHSAMARYTCKACGFRAR